MSLLRIVLASCILTVSAASTFANDFKCPQELRSLSEDDIAYRSKGDRCEGVFTRPVSAAVNLSLIGAHLAAPILPDDKATYVQVAVPKLAPADKLALRILSSKPRQYYRLDAKLGRDAPFNWPPDIRTNELVSLESPFIHGLACKGSCDDRSPTVIPIQIGNEAKQSRGVNLWFRAAVDLKQVFVTATRSDGAAVFTDAPLLRSKPLELANTAFETKEINLAPGQYKFKVTGIPLSGDALDVLRFTLLVPGN